MGAAVPSAAGADPGSKTSSGILAVGTTPTGAPQGPVLDGAPRPAAGARPAPTSSLAGIADAEVMEESLVVGLFASAGGTASAVSVAASAAVTTAAFCRY